jgi:hypothetical protein
MEIEDIKNPEKITIKKLHKGIEINFKDRDYARFARAALLAAGTKEEDLGIRKGNLGYAFGISVAHGITEEDSQFGHSPLCLENMSEKQFYALMEDALKISKGIQAKAKEHGAVLGDLSLRFSKKQLMSFVTLFSTGGTTETNNAFAATLNKANIPANSNDQGPGRTFIQMLIAPDTKPPLLERMRTFALEAPQNTIVPKAAMPFAEIVAAPPDALGNLKRAGIRKEKTINYRQNGNQLVITFPLDVSKADDVESEWAKFARTALFAAGKKPEEIGVVMNDLRNAHIVSAIGGLSKENEVLSKRTLVIDNMTPDEFYRVMERTFDAAAAFHNLAGDRKITLSVPTLRFSEGDKKTKDDDRIKLVFPAPEVTKNQLPSTSLPRKLTEAGIPTVFAKIRKIDGDLRDYGFDMDVPADGVPLLDKLEDAVKTLQRARKGQAPRTP